MRLILEIAFTHIAGRGRQTIVAILGVAVGVGFSIAMAGLMQGSQKDFIEQLVDAMPHVQITDDRRAPPRHPKPRDWSPWAQTRPSAINCSPPTTITPTSPA